MCVCVCVCVCVHWLYGIQGVSLQPVASGCVLYMVCAAYMVCARFVPYHTRFVPYHSSVFCLPLLVVCHPHTATHKAYTRTGCVSPTHGVVCCPYTVTGCVSPTHSDTQGLHRYTHTLCAVCVAHTLCSRCVYKASPYCLLGE